MIEVCTGSYQDCLAAYHGGAKRVELNSALYLGGLTPSVGTLRLVKQDTDLKVICMIRPRAAGFNYNDDEIKVMFMDAKILLDNGADGIAFGFLNMDQSLNLKNTEQMIKLIHSYHKEAVFHRAFDICSDPLKAIDQLIKLDCDRILTSGCMPKAVEGKDMLKKLQTKYGDQIEILAGSGINDSNAKQLMQDTGIRQVHSSCKKFNIDHATSTITTSFRYYDDDTYEAVDEMLVTKLIDSLK